MPCPFSLPDRRTLQKLRLSLVILCAIVLTGCAGNQIVRGQLHYDVRPPESRAELVWPQPPDPPRYRYVGELVGEQNFERKAKKGDVFVSALKWAVGLFENHEPLTLLRPQHGVVDDKGRIYIVDTARSAVLVFDPNPPADGKSNDDGGQLLVWGARESTYRLGAPMAVAVVWDGDIAVSDAKLGGVIRFNTKGEFVAGFGAGQLKRPTGLAFDRKRGLLFVSDTEASDIKVYDSSGDLVEVISGPAEEEGTLNAPTHLAFEGEHLYVTDTLNSRVQVFDTHGMRVGGFGERGLYIGNMARPKGVATDGKGITYVIESYYGYLLAYNERNQLLLGIHGSGAKDDRFVLPSGVWTDKQRRVYVADMFNGRVVVFQLLDAKD